MTATHYRHTDGGGWLALVHDGRALLVEASVERALDLWPALLESADALLDRLTAGGLSAVPAFAFAEADAQGGLRTILRGPVAATVSSAGGSTERSGAGVATWREDADASATAVQLRRAAATAVSTAGLLPIVSGIVATDALAFDATAAAPVARTVVPSAPTAAEAGASPVPAMTPGPVPTASVPPLPVAAQPEAPTPDGPEEDVAIDERTSVLPRRRPVDAPTAADEDAAPTEATDSPESAETESSAVPELTLLPENTVLPVPAAPDDPTPADPTSQDDYDYLFGSTVIGSVADAAVREHAEDEAVAPATAEAPASADPSPATGRLDVPAAGDHDGHTVMAEDLAELRARRREQGSTPAPPAPAPSLHLLRHDGVVESLDQPVLVGRAPSVSQVPGGRIPRLVTVTSLGQDISRNHVQFAVEGGTVVVTDLHSRNGTHVVMPGKSPQKLRQGEPTAVIAGTVIDLGGGVTFTVSED